MACHNPEGIATQHRDWRWPAAICWLVFALLFSTGASAIPTVNIDKPVYERLSLQGSLEYYAPGVQNPSIEEILAVNDYHWKPDSSLPASLAFAPRQTLWYRLQITNNTTTPQALILSNTNPAADWTDAYAVTTNNASRAGQPAVVKLLHYETHMHTLHFVAPPQSIQTLYIAIRGFHGGQVPLNLHDTHTYERQDQHYHWHSGLIDGAILGLMIYNLLLWGKTRETMYLAYMLLGLFNLLTIATHQGILTHLLPFLNEEWNTNLSLVFPLNVSQCLAYFFQHFMETGKYHPRLHLFLQAYIASTLVIAAAFLLGAPMIITTPIFFATSTTAIYLMLRTTYLRKMKPETVRWLLLGGLVMPIVSGLITLLAASGVSVLERDYMTFMQMTDVMEMLLLSAAMAYKISQLQHEHRDQLGRATEEFITHAAQNRLLAHINHEFRTPLNGIIGATELLIGKSENANTDTVNMIYQTALPLKMLIDDLVNINATSENRKKLVKTRFDLEQLLQECSDMFMPAARKQDIRLYFTIDHAIPSNVNGDPYRLRQIILNLLGNAFKFTRNGIIGVSVSQEQATGAFRFEVYDSGNTIPPDIQAKLFQQFAKGSTHSELPGAGLGLSIVKELSQTMGGDCGYIPAPEAYAAAATSEAGSGNLFWFTVKLESYLYIKRTTQAIFEHRRILIADENPLIARQLAKAIGNKHALLETACTREQLHALAISKHFDIAIVQLSLVNAGFDCSALEDIHAVCLYNDNQDYLQNSLLQYPVIIRPSSLRKFVFNIANALATVNRKHNHLADLEAEPTRYRVLVAEDNPTSQIIISEILKRFPLAVDICSNGKEAEQAFLAMVQAGTPYDAVFMDCEMPLQDGFQTTRRIRDYEKRNAMKNTFIAALTAHNEVEYKLKSREAGMDDFLSKPISIDSINLCIQKAGLAS